MNVIIQTDLSFIHANFLRSFYNTPHKQTFWFPKKEPINMWLSNNIRPGNPDFEISSPFEISVQLIGKKEHEIYHMPKISMFAFNKMITDLYKNWIRTQYSAGIARGLTRYLTLFEIMEFLNLIPEHILVQIKKLDVHDPDAIRFMRDLILENQECNRFYERVARDFSRYVVRKNIAKKYYAKNN